MNPEYRYSRYYTYIKPILKSPTVRTYGEPIFTLIVMAIFIIYAIKPTIETISNLQQKIQEYKQAEAQLTQKTQDLAQARINYKALDPNVKILIQEKLPNNPDLKTLIQTLEQTALTNDSSISALQIDPLKIDAPDPTKVPNKLTEISFTFNVEGSYANLLNILTALYQNIRIISITNLTVNKVEATGNLFMTIIGKAYYLK